jgi:hypothetical protein
MKSLGGGRDPFGPPAEAEAAPLMARGGRSRAWAWL